MSGPTFRSTQAPRGELFADSGAAAVWAAIQLLSEQSRRELLDAFVAEQIIPDLRSSQRQAQIARALASLREAHELLLLEAEDDYAEAADQVTADSSEPPRLSVEAYRRLHREHGRRLGWPPDGTIRGWIAGSWNDCLRDAGLEIVADGDAVVREIGGALTREECMAAVRNYAREMGIELPTLTGYLRWARAPKVRRRPGRRPMSQGPIHRLFASWGDVLVQAGIAQPDPVGGVGRSLRCTDPGGRTVYLRSGYCYSDDQLRGAMREIAERLGHSPKTAQYKAERDKLLSEELASGGPPRAFPSLALLQKRYESWDDALRDAGLEATDGRHNPTGCVRRRNSRAVTPEMIIEAIREAYLAKGDTFTQAIYSTWRTEQRARDLRERRIRRIPSYDAIWARYGTWQAAVIAAFDGWEPDSGRAAAATDAAADERSGS